jgi:hypothetical protein
MSFKVGQKVTRTIKWDDGETWVNGGEVVGMEGRVVVCRIWVDQPRTMRFFADDGRTVDLMDGMEDEWIEAEEGV